MSFHPLAAGTSRGGAISAAHRVLVVEDSRSARELLVGFLGSLAGIAVDAVGSMAEARQVLAAATSPYLCAVLDLGLPDAPNGEIVPCARRHGVPVVVLTGTYSDESSAALMAQGVIDYVVKRQTSACATSPTSCAACATTHGTRCWSWTTRRFSASTPWGCCSSTRT